MSISRSGTKSYLQAVLILTASLFLAGCFHDNDPDTKAPTVTVDSLNSNDNKPQLTGTVDDSTASISVTVDGNVYAATNNGDRTWTLADNTISPALLDGTYDISVTATDPAANVGSDATTDELVVAVPLATGLQTTQSSGVEREYYLQLPSDYDDGNAVQATALGDDTRKPLLFAYHGYTGSYQNWVGENRFYDFVDVVDCCLHTPHRLDLFLYCFVTVWFIVPAIVEIYFFRVPHGGNVVVVYEPVCRLRPGFVPLL